MKIKNLQKGISNDFSYLLGVVGGDGTIYIKDRKQYVVSVSDKDMRYHKILRRIFEKTLQFTPKIFPAGDRNAWYLVVHSKPITKLFANFYSTGRRKTYYDRLPSKIYNCNRNAKLQFIAGYIDAEGTSNVKRFKTKYGKYIYPCVVVETVNKNFLYDMYTLSKDIGIPSTKPIHAKRNYRKGQKDRYFICWNGFKKCNIISNVMRHPTKLNRLRYYMASSRRPT